jgi:hypothetical protein
MIATFNVKVSDVTKPQVSQVHYVAQYISAHEKQVGLSIYHFEIKVNIPIPVKQTLCLAFPQQQHSTTQ